jgi:hypothetical protein
MIVMPRSATTDRQPLPRDLAELLHELLAAYQRFTMYPDGHPLLEPAVSALARRLDAALLDRAVVAVGVTPGGLIVSGMAAPPSALVGECADRIYRRNIGGLRIARGVRRDEITSLLRALLTDATAAPFRSRHVRVFPLNFDHLALLDAADADGAEGGALGAEWASQLWLGLVRATVGGIGDDVTLGADPDLLAQALTANADPSTAARLLESLSAIARAVEDRGHAEGAALQRHLVRLIRSLSPDVLERLLRTGATPERRRAFLAEVTPALTTEVVLALLQAAGRADGTALSPALIQLLEKLASHSEHGSDAARPRADDAFRRRIRELVERWGMQPEEPPADPDYVAALARLPRGGLDLTDPARVYAADPERIVQLSVELGMVEAPTLRAADRLVLEGRIGTLLDILDAAPDDAPVARTLRARVCRESTVRLLLGADSVDLDALARVVPATGAPAAEPMLDSLASQKDRRVRARVLELLATVGPAAGPPAVARLAGAPWYLQRNLLRVLGRLPILPEGFDASPYADHADARVRREALKLMLADPRCRDAAIVRALEAPDLPTVRLGLLAAAEECPAAAVPLILRRISAETLDDELRAIALRAVAPVQMPAVLDALIRACVVRGPFFIGRRLAPKSPSVLAAVTGLAVHWRWDPRAERALGLAHRVRDVELRDAADPRDAVPQPARGHVILVPR